MNHLSIWILVHVAIWLPLQTGKHSQAQETIAYTDATLETMGPDGRLEHATLLVRGDTIVAVGEDVEIPDDARVVSMADKTIVPGIIDPYFVFGKPARPTTAPPTPARGRRIGRPSSQRFSAGSFTKVGEHFYPYTTDFDPAIRTGITTAQLVTDGRGLSALAHLNPVPDDNMLLTDPGFLFTKITNQTGALDILRNGLDPDSARDSGRGSRVRGRGGFGRGRPAGNDNERAEANDDNETAREVDDDETTRMWKAVREGKRRLVVNANNAATVAHLLKLLGKFDKVQLILVSSGPNVYQSLDEIRDQQVTLVLQPGIDVVPYTSERMNVAKMIADRGIPFALSLSLNETQMKATQDDPLFPVSVLVKTGLSRKAAMEALTIRPAQILGIEKSHGSLEAKKVANMLVFDGDPLATGSVLRKVIVKGKLVHEN